MSDIGLQFENAKAIMSKTNDNKQFQTISNDDYSYSKNF